MRRTGVGPKSDKKLVGYAPYGGHPGNMIRPHGWRVHKSYQGKQHVTAMRPRPSRFRAVPDVHNVLENVCDTLFNVSGSYPILQPLVQKCKPGQHNQWSGIACALDTNFYFSHCLLPENLHQPTVLIN